MNKLSLTAIAGTVGVIALLFVVYMVFFSAPQVEASRLVVRGGDLYRASDVFSAKRITNRKDIALLFDDERNGRILIGKGLVRQSENAHASVGTQLFIANADGSDERAITEEAEVKQAFFDRRGENVFYLRTTDGGIYRHNVQSEKSDRIAIGASPDLSPDGTRLLYYKAPSGWSPGQYYEGAPGFAIFDLATGNETLVPNTAPDDSGGGYSPLWTPDGQHIITFDNLGLSIMNLDGTGHVQLTQSGDGTNAYGISDDPLWSSDGRYFIYHADYKIMVVELDIANKRVISAGPIAYGVKPRWVEEGKTISVISPEVTEDEATMSVIDLNGKVVSGDRNSQRTIRLQVPEGYRTALSGRVAPKPVPPPPPPEPVIPVVTPQLQGEQSLQEIPNSRDRADGVRREVPAEAVVPAQQ